MSSSAFGLELGEKHLKIVDCEKKGDKYFIKGLVIEELPINLYLTDDEKNVEAIVPIIEKSLKNAGIKKKNVNVVIPNSYSYARIIEMPMLTEKELISAIKYQADQIIPIPIDKVSLDIEIIHEDKQKRKKYILLVAASNIVINKASELIESAGLTADAIENETSSTLRFIGDVFNKKNTASTSQYLILINFGYSSTSIYLVDTMTQLPLEFHSWSLGVNLFLKDIQANFNISDSDTKKVLESIGFSDQASTYNLPQILSTPYNELVTEVQRFLMTVKEKFSVTAPAIFMTGGGTKIAGLTKSLSASLKTEIVLFDVASLCIQNNIVEANKKDLSLFVTAIGENLR